MSFADSPKARQCSVIDWELYAERDHLEISHDGTATWADLQAIKNEVWGEDTVAIEIYPPQEFVVNGGSTEFHYRHLWKVPSWMPWPNLRQGDF